MPEIQMPKLSDTMTEGTLVAWKKKKGDKKKKKKPEKKEEKKKPEGKEEKEATAEKKEEKKVDKKPEAKAEKPAPKIDKGEEARVKASPVARRIAAELGVDLSRVNGTGPEGRVTETDVRAAAKSKTTSAPQKP